MDSQKYVNLLNSNNLQDDLRSFSYEERLSILDERNFLANIALDRIVDESILLYNRRESLKTLKELGYLYTDALQKRKYKSKLFDLGDDDLIEFFISSLNDNILKFVKNKKLILNCLDKIDINYVDLVFPYLDDEDLIDLLNNEKYRGYSSYIIQNFKSDENKIRFFGRVLITDIPYVIATFSEENIRKYLTPFIGKKGLIISKLSSDQEKEKYLNLYKLILTFEDKVNILCSFKDKNYVHKYANYLNSDKACYFYIDKLLKGDADKFKSDLDFNLRIIDLISDDYYLDLIIPQLNWILKDINITKRYIDKIKNPRHIFNLFTDLDEKELTEYLLPKMSQRYIQKYIRENIDKIKTYKILLLLKDNRLLFKALEHSNSNRPYSEDMYPIFVKVAKRYKLNLNHLISLAKVTTWSILSQVSNKNIKDAINLDEENFQKYLKLFENKNTELTKNSVSTILYSLLNNAFSIENPMFVQLYFVTLHAVDDGDVEKAIKIVNQILNSEDLDNSNIDHQKLLDGVLKKDPEMLKLYKDMVNKYLVVLRNYYVNTHMEKALSSISSPSYNVNELIKYIFKSLPEKNLYDIIINETQRINLFKYKDIYEDENILKKLISFKKNPRNGIDPELKPYLIKFNDFLSTVFGNFKYRRGDLIKIKELKIEHNFSYSSKVHLLEIMSELDVEALKQLLFNNEELYNELSKYLDKYDVLGWAGRFGKITSDTDVDMSSETIASLINNFGLIQREKSAKEQKGEAFTFISELTYAECLSEDAKMYQNLFGRENYRFLRSNPYPNRSPESKRNRLAYGLEYLKLAHEREYIAVPPINKDFKLESGKTLNIIIGNTNDPINLTYGERTGSCMRIGGAGRTLFDFCLRNDNGFHVSFNDPETGELVSRVSCYRNGNTVFFNEVRNSLNDKYTNKEIQEAATLIGEEIIELTKNSKYPVKNIITSNHYAFEKCKTTNINCEDPTFGFDNKFYTDITRSAIVLASSTGSIPSIELGPDNCEKYLVGRSPVKKYSKEKAVYQIMHIETLDEYLSGTPIDEIDVNEKEIEYAYSGEDWYVAITPKNKIITYVSKSSRNKEKAMEEMNNYLEITKESLKYVDVDSDDDLKRRTL